MPQEIFPIHIYQYIFYTVCYSFMSPKIFEIFLRARIHFKITSEIFTQRQQHFLQSYVSIGLSLTRWDFLTVILIGLLNAKKKQREKLPPYRDFFDILKFKRLRIDAETTSYPLEESF